MDNLGGVDELRYFLFLFGGVKMIMDVFLGFLGKGGCKRTLGILGRMHYHVSQNLRGYTKLGVLLFQTSCFSSFS